MCQQCGQFNAINTRPVVKVVIVDGNDILLPEQTLVGRNNDRLRTAKDSKRNSRLRDSKQMLGEIWRTPQTKQFIDIAGNVVELCGNDIERIVVATVTTTSYDGSVLSTRVS